MADVSTDVRASFAAAQRAQMAHCDALNEFHAACALGDDAAAERARIRVVGSMEAFVDHHAAAYRRMRDKV